MSVIAVIYLCALVGFFVGIWASKPNAFTGAAATLVFWSLVLSGLTLAVDAL